MIIGDHARNVGLIHFYDILRHITDQSDFSLTIRQLAVLLTCYLFDEEHTVRRLATRLGLAKTAVSRMLEHLVHEGLLERRADPRDRRSVLFERTLAGNSFLERISRPVPQPAVHPHRRQRR